MPVMKVYPNGVTMGRAPGKNDHERGKRGEVKGWSASAARRNLAFLRSVEDDKLDGYGYTVSLLCAIARIQQTIGNGSGRRFLSVLSAWA